MLLTLSVPRRKSKVKVTWYQLVPRLPL